VFAIKHQTNLVPLVSCLLPITQFDDFAIMAIDSILNQTYQNFEILLLCNNITDADFARLHSAYSQNKQLIIHRINLPGLCFALNFGLNEAVGEFIARMDADDISLPQRFEKQVAHLLRNQNTVLVGCKVKLIDECGSDIGYFPFFENSKKIKSLLPIRNTLVHPALMFRRSTVLQIGGYKYGFMSEDHELFLRLLDIPDTDFYNIPIELFLYRRHKNQITNSLDKKKHFAEITPFLLMNFLKRRKFSYILGIFWVLPITRWVKDYFKKLVSQFNKFKKVFKD